MLHHSIFNFCLKLKSVSWCFFLLHSHKKRKDSLESSLNRALFGAELEFPKILVPRLPQNSSNVNIEYAGKSKQLYSIYSLCDQLPGAMTSSFYYSDINLFLIDYAYCKLCNISLLFFKNNSRSYHYTGVSHWRKTIVAVITQDRVADDYLKRQTKNRTLYTCRLFLLTRIFQHINNWSKVFTHPLFSIYIE